MRTPKIIGSTTLGAFAAGTLLSVGLASAPAANASCASFWGIGNSADCTSSIGSVAIALGTGAKATATGLFGTAFAAGDNAIATNLGSFTFAITAGNSSAAYTTGLFNIAAQLGSGGQASAEGLSSAGNLGFNISLNIGPGANPWSYVSTNGIGNIAVNLFGTGTGAFDTNSVTASGIINVAANLGGQKNHLTAVGGSSGAFNTAFNIAGSTNNVTAGTGPFAIAGTILQSNASVVKSGPGFNINGIVVGGASAVNARKASPAAASKPKAANSSAENAKSTGGSKRAKKAD
ncbi:hypothetical protein OG976_03100 [Mycobacterium sp. NBC_00419]|uniref:hypothetical protein n=1 Tax=Mycobacterium sp. NBC_00419 TaxID=2975989 RepID=UPI002E1AAE14